MSESIRLAHNASKRRYELFVGSELASTAEYNEAAGDTLIFDHTETTPAFRGKGLAARVVAYALDDVRARGRSVVPVCWFVADFIDDNPEYADLLAERATA